MNIKLPEQVNTAIKLLEESGFEAFAVGGCVRDMIMGRTPYDYDVTTNALPDEMAEVFRGMRQLDIGLKHGTLTVIIGDMPIEITTYRIDGEYLDSRHPDSVKFSRSLSDDLSRRDFTVNTLCFNERVGLVDEFGGVSDIENRIIRCVGEPDKRFTEDALRIIRAVRFACALGFTVEEKTAESILRNKALLSNIAIERIRDEFTKLIMSDQVFDILEEFHAVIEEFIPEYADLYTCEQNTPYHCYGAFEHTLKALESSEKDTAIRLCMFFHDIAKPLCRKTDEYGVDHFKGHALLGAEMAENILKRMRYSKAVTSKVCKLISLHSEPCPKTKQQAKLFLSLHGEETYEDFIKVRRADMLAKADPHSQDEKLDNMLSFLNEIRQNGECRSLSSLAVNGNDLKAAGITKGQEIKRVLDLELKMKRKNCYSLRKSLQNKL